MLALILASTLAAAGSCQERCATDSSRCYSSCNGGGQCTHHCDSRSIDCNALCAKDEKKQENAAKRKDMPCPSSGPGKPSRPCTEAELKPYKDALNSKEVKRTLCKDKKGQLTPCNPELREKEKEMLQIVKKDGICRDDQGIPHPCPGTAEKLQKAGRRMSH
jgi:hypothetical protein